MQMRPNATAPMQRHHSRKWSWPVGSVEMPRQQELALNVGKGDVNGGRARCLHVCRVHADKHSEDNTNTTPKKVPGLSCIACSSSLALF